MVILRSKTVFQNEACDALLIEPERIGFAFVLREMLVGAAGTNDECGCGGVGRKMRIVKF